MEEKEKRIGNREITNEGSQRISKQLYNFVHIANLEKCSILTSINCMISAGISQKEEKHFSVCSQDTDAKNFRKMLHIKK